MGVRAYFEYRHLVYKYILVFSFLSITHSHLYKYYCTIRISWMRWYTVVVPVSISPRENSQIALALHHSIPITYISIHITYHTPSWVKRVFWSASRETSRLTCIIRTSRWGHIIIITLGFCGPAYYYIYHAGKLHIHTRVKPQTTILCLRSSAIIRVDRASPFFAGTK